MDVHIVPFKMLSVMYGFMIVVMPDLLNRQLIFYILDHFAIRVISIFNNSPFTALPAPSALYSLNLTLVEHLPPFDYKK